MIRAPLFANSAAQVVRITRSAGRRSIAPVSDRVHENLLHARFLCRRGQRDQMLVVAVHAAIGNQPDKMQPSVARFRKGLPQNFVPLQLAVRDRLVNPGQVLINDPARAEVEMADLGVSHLPCGQPDVLAARAQRSAGIFAIEPIVKRVFARGEWRRRSFPAPLFRPD